MIVLGGILEAGYESTMEHLCWRQLKNAYNVGLALVGHDFDSMEDLLSAHPSYRRVFMIPPGRIESQNFNDYVPPDGDVLYVFGRPGNNLVKYVEEGDAVVSIHTPGDVDMMAISVVGIVLNGHR